MYLQTRCWQIDLKMNILLILLHRDTLTYSEEKGSEELLCGKQTPQRLLTLWFMKGGGEVERMKERKREWEMDTAKSALGVSVLAAHLLIDLSIDPAFCLWVFFPSMVLNSMLTVSSPSPSSPSFTFTSHLTSLSIHLSIPPSILPHSFWMLCDALQSHIINGRGSWKMICTYLGDFSIVVIDNTFTDTTRLFHLSFSVLLCF